MGVHGRKGGGNGKIKEKLQENGIREEKQDRYQIERREKGGKEITKKGGKGERRSRKRK